MGERGIYTNPGDASCSALLQLQMNRAKLALAKQLLDDGLITDEEMKKTVASMHRSLGIR